MNMNCEDCRKAMRAAIDTDAGLDAATRAHLSRCDECHEDYTDWMLERALEHDWVPPAPDDFADRAIAGAIRDSRSRIGRYAVAASIAVLGVAIGLFVGMNVGPRMQETVARVAMVANEGKTVRLLIDSAAAHDVATVTVELADNLELTGFPNEHRIEWQTQLAAGRNLLPLPLTLLNPTDTEFRVGLRYGSVRQDIRVSVKAEPSGFKA
jgi:hypothetical protein